MRITESRLRSLIKDILIENDFQSLRNNPNKDRTKSFITPHRRNVSKEDLENNFFKVIKSQTNLYNIISYYTETNEEIPSAVLHAFGVIVSYMYEKSFSEKLNRDDRRYIKILITKLMSSYPDNVTIDL